MIEKFATVGGEVPGEFLDLNHASNLMDSSVPRDCEVRFHTQRSNTQPRTLANFGIGTPA